MRKIILILIFIFLNNFELKNAFAQISKLTTTHSINSEMNNKKEKLSSVEKDYFQKIEGIINDNWQKPKLNLEKTVTLAVLLEIKKDGSIAKLTITKPSNIEVFDNSILKAIEVSRFPLLPISLLENNKVGHVFYFKYP